MSREIDTTDFAVVPSDEQQAIEIKDFHDDEAPSATCAICKVDNGESLVSVTEKGLTTLVTFCKIRSESTLLHDLQKSKAANSPVYVHKICRKNFTNPRKKTQALNVGSQNAVHVTRSQISAFDWKIQCFFCGLSLKTDEKHRERSSISQTEIPSKGTVHEMCKTRNDDWGNEVELRLCDINDFVASQARYHRQCRANFFNGQGKPGDEHLPSGRPVNNEMSENFVKLCNWLDKQVELFTVTQLHQKMASFSASIDTVYGVKWFKEKLKEHYKEEIYFSEETGKSNVVCFRDSTIKILTEENRAVLRAAVNILRKEIRNTKFENEYYPSTEDILAVKDFLPPMLRYFMECLVPLSDLKQAALGQCLLKAVKPYNMIPPLLFGLAVEIDHSLGSKVLLTTAAHLGYAVGPEEVRRHKQSVAVDENANLTDEADGSSPEMAPNSFFQWVADNADHNAKTLDGKETFHLMGIIECATYTSAPMPTMRRKRVKRIREMLKSEEAVKCHRVKIFPYNYPDVRALSKFILKPIDDILFQVPHPRVSLNIDLLWHTAGIFKKYDRQGPRPSWNGYMDLASLGLAHPTKSTITTLPFIDLNPSDESCILSTIMYVVELARKRKIPTPCITFDQPLWIKAVEIIKSMKLNVVVRLGGFHTLMSFVGSIGMIMEGSGLEKVMETVYGTNTVNQMLFGKSISRALRGHYLVDGALKMRILAPILSQCEEEDLRREEDEMNVEPSPLTKEEVRDLRELFDKTENSDLYSDKLEKSELLEKLRSILCKKINFIREFRTGKLWVQYMNYVDITKFFTRAERSGNWEDHLKAVSMMINLFAAAGHHHYAKCARLYLQMMRDLERDHPWLHKQFIEKGFHCVRRTDKYWAGLWTDLTIEQTLMRAMKSNGGLTRGRGMDESTRTLWVTTLHKCAEVEAAMREVTHTRRESSEQHKELTRSRCQRDFEDLEKICQWFDQFDPFDTSDKRLRSLSTGLVAQSNDKINCDDAEAVGYAIQKKLDSIPYSNAKVEKKDKIKPLLQLSKGVTVGDQEVHIDPLVLFLRLVLLIEREDDNAPYFDYELTPFPAALFKNKLMRRTSKSALAKALTECPKKTAKGKKRKHEEIDSTEEDDDGFPDDLDPDDLVDSAQSKHVVDGGAFLRRIDWNGVTVGDIIKGAKLKLKKYGPCTIVFDGYESSTKDHEHQRRLQALKTPPAADMLVELNCEMNYPRDQFLANTKNKVQFIKHLSEELSKEYHVINCREDADTTIVKEALKFAQEGCSVTIVGEDTDILVLLLHHWAPSMANIFLRSEPKKNSRLKLINIERYSMKLSSTVKDNLLFIHAWGGCDTTSATFGHGKSKILKLVGMKRPQPDVMAACSIFNTEDANQEDIIKSGTDLFKIMYGGKIDDQLGHLRKLQFHEMSASSKSVKPEILPPTFEAARQHSLRVYYQVQDWKCLGQSSLLPTDWGWYIEQSTYHPIMSLQDPAPAKILNVVRCNCKSSSKNQCGTNVCSCRKSGLVCVSACGGCHGVGCNNTRGFIPEEIDTQEGQVQEVDDGNIFEKLFS